MVIFCPICIDLFVRYAYHVNRWICSIYIRIRHYFVKRRHGCPQDNLFCQRKTVLLQERLELSMFWRHQTLKKPNAKLLWLKKASYWCLELNYLKLDKEQHAQSLNLDGGFRYTLQVYNENAQKLRSTGEIMHYKGAFQCPNGIKHFSTLLHVIS